MQCKDIDEISILMFLHIHEGEWCNWFEDSDKSVINIMPKNTPPKLALAKMRKMVRKGLVSGCYCGCRGDFEITKKGRDLLIGKLLIEGH